MNKLLLEKMQNRLDQKNVKYITRENVIILNMNVGDVVGSLSISIHILEDGYVAYASLSNHATDESFGKISEYLHRANLGLAYGNFEMDYHDGEIRYKYSTEIDNPNNISNKTLDKCILLPCLMFKRYGSGIIKLLVGVGTPEELVNEADTSSDE